MDETGLSMRPAEDRVLLAESPVKGAAGQLRDTMTGRGDKYSRLEYRRLIAWPQRIHREGPFLHEVLSSGPAERILDLGCGTGEHARFLVSQGFTVVGVDSSESMIEAACEEPLPDGLEFVLGDMRQIDRVTEGSFGGAICLGNALPHLRTDEDLGSLLQGLRRRLRAGAPFVLQVVNYERVFAQNLRHLPLSYRPDEEGEIVFLRLLELRPDGRVLFFPSTFHLRPGHEPPLELKASKEVELRGWRASEIEEALEAAGFHERTLFGGFDRTPFSLAILFRKAKSVPRWLSCSVVV